MRGALVALMLAPVQRATHPEGVGPVASVGSWSFSAVADSEVMGSSQPRRVSHLARKLGAPSPPLAEAGRRVTKRSHRPASAVYLGRRASWGLG